MTEILSIFADPANWAAIAALIAMEVVLGIDNLIFISILTNKLPEAMRGTARKVGISLALILRLVLLGFVAFIVTLTAPLFQLGDHGVSWRDLILIAGGLFLVWKATKEIHHSVDHDEAAVDAQAGAGKIGLGFGAAIFQIIMLDLVFSIDSIVTAVGMTDHVPIMFLAVIVAVAAMATAAGPLSRFIEQNPTVVMLALAFLFMIGMTLIADGFGHHVPKGYIYAAMGFSALVEALNIFARRRKEKARAAH
jgi:predicted tellurium resistance membrane protein TerC